jgi:membrane-bound inhibitor of C-type lysozyme
VKGKTVVIQYAEQTTVKQKESSASQGNHLEMETKNITYNCSTQKLLFVQIQRWKGLSVLHNTITK